jgi:hypothetical protein
MPTYEIAAPDGKTYRIDGPPGASDEQVRQQVLAQHPGAGTAVSRAAAPTPKAFDPTEGMSTAGKFGVGILQGITELGRGIKQFSAAGPLTEEGRERQQQYQAEYDEARRLDAPLMASRAARAGSLVGQAAVTAPLAAIPGAGTALGAAALGGGLGAISPVAGDESRAANIGLGAASGVAGKFAGDLAAYGVGKLAGRVRPAAPATPATRSMDAGYRLPPSMAKANPGLLDTLVEGIGGKVRTEQDFSVANQANTNRLVRQALGLGEGEKVPLEEVLKAREDAGEAYNAIKTFGGTFTETPAYRAKLDLIKRVGSTKSSRKILNPEQVANLVEDLKGDLAPDEAIEVVKKLRADSSFNIASRDPNARALGHAQRKAADAVDGLIGEHLQGTEFYGLYRQARQVIAKTYDVQNALNETTGDVSALKLAKALKNRPLSAELKDVAKFGQAFPGVARDTTKAGSRPGSKLGVLDIGAAAVTAAHHPAVAAGVLSRPLARQYLLSDIAQNRLRATAAPTLERQLLPPLGAVGAANVALQPTPPSLQDMQRPPGY